MTGYISDNTKTDYTISGVSGPFNYSIYEESTGFVFHQLTGNHIGHCYIKCHPEQVGEVRKWVVGVLQQELPASVEFEVNTLLDDVHEIQIVEYTLRKVFIFFYWCPIKIFKYDKI